MAKLDVARATVESARAEEFEAAVLAESGASNSAETVLSVVCRRDGAGSTLFAAPPGNHSEYFLVRAAAQDSPHSPGSMSLPGPVQVSSAEEFAAPAVAGVTRDHKWSPETVFRLAMFRFKVSSERAGAFEEEARRQISMVTGNEPGTILYSFARRQDGAGGLLPKAPAGQAEYFHLMAYVSEEAQALHREFEHRADGWAWGRTFRDYLVAPLESESFPAMLIVAGRSSDSIWRPPAESR